MLRVLLLVALMASCVTPKPPEPIPVPDPLPPTDPRESCLDLGNYQLDKKGPYGVTRQTIGKVKIYKPILNRTCKMVISHYSNGTGAPCAYYNEVNDHLASYGFLATCYESRQTGSGKPCTDAITTALNSYSGKVLTDKFVSTGHSQGGGAAHTCQYLLEQKYPSAKIASIGIAPAHGMSRYSFRTEYPKIKGPVLMVSGSRDTNVPNGWVSLGYDLIKSDKQWIQMVGANHFNTNPWAKQSILTWSAWKLFDDKTSKMYFDGMMKSKYWKLINKN